VDLLAEIGHELRVGDAAQIRASYVRQQKTDKRDAAHILKLLVEAEAAGGRTISACRGAVK
jgi:transposase